MSKEINSNGSHHRENKQHDYVNSLYSMAHFAEKLFKDTMCDYPEIDNEHYRVQAFTKKANEGVISVNLWVFLTDTNDVELEPSILLHVMNITLVATYDNSTGQFTVTIVDTSKHHLGDVLFVSHSYSPTKRLQKYLPKIIKSRIENDVLNK